MLQENSATAVIVHVVSLKTAEFDPAKRLILPDSTLLPVCSTVFQSVKHNHVTVSTDKALKLTALYRFMS